MIDEISLVRAVLEGNYHRGGLKCARLYHVDSQFLARLRGEVEAIAPVQAVSDEHQGAYTRPYGSVRQFSLYNRTGDWSDRSSDYDPNPQGKQLPDEVQYPSLHQLLKTFPDLLNVRLNCLGAGAGLSDHEEELFISGEDGLQLRLRFHLPIVTNADCEVLLDGARFHLPLGEISYFNNGCVHAARNRGDEERYHLVWDVILTRRSFGAFFGARLAGDFLIPIFDRAIPVMGQEAVGPFQSARRYERLYERLHLSAFGISKTWFFNLYNRLAWRRYRFPQFIQIPV